MKNQAISYVRVSSKKQDLERQIRELEKFASTKDYKIIKCFQDTLSASKSSMSEREGFNNLRKYLESNQL